MANVDPSWTTFFKEKENPFHGSVTSLAEAEALIREYEMVTRSRYVILRETKKFGSFDLSCSHKVKHVDDGKIKKGSRIMNHGVPFMICGQKLMECHQGSTYRLPKLLKEKTDHNYERNPPKKKVSKKVGCKSSIMLREAVFFPDFKPVSSTEHHQKQKSKLLRTALASSDADSIRLEKKIFIDLPPEDSHSDHLPWKARYKAPSDRHVDVDMEAEVEDDVTTTGEFVMDKEKGKDREIIQKEFRDKLAVLTQMSYLCHDSETLERSTETINNLISTMQSKCEDDLILDDLGRESSQTSHSLPKPKKLKNCQRKRTIPLNEEVVEEFVEDIHIIISEDGNAIWTC